MVQLSSAMLLDLYRCAGSGEAWRPLLDRMCATFGARSAVAQMFQRDSGRVRQSWTMRDSFSTANAALHDMLVNNPDNPRTDPTLMSAVSARRILRDRDRFRDGCERLAGLQRRLAAIGLGEAITLGIPLGPHTVFSLTLHRAAHDVRPFGTSAEAELRHLAPHFEQMLGLSGEREGMAAHLGACTTVLDRLACGVLLCDRARRVGWLNAAAQDMLDRSRHLVVRDRVLHGAQSVATARLDAALAALGPGREHDLFAIGDDDAAVHVLAVPLGAEAADHGVALLLCEANRPRALAGADIAALFGLTPAEGALAAALCNGRTVQEHAAGRGIAIGTARVQLKRVLSKVEVHRQSDLVLRICGSVIGQTLAPPPAYPKWEFRAVAERA